MNENLKIGSFYWVLIVFDPDAEPEWMNEDQPARYAGKNEQGEDIWHYLGIEGDSTWPVRWIGPEIVK